MAFLFDYHELVQFNRFILLKLPLPLTNGLPLENDSLSPRSPLSILSLKSLICEVFKLEFSLISGISFSSSTLLTTSSRN